MDHLTAQPQLVVISVLLEIKLKDQLMTQKEHKPIITKSFSCSNLVISNTQKWGREKYTATAFHQPHKFNESI